MSGWVRKTCLYAIAGAVAIAHSAAADPIDDEDPNAPKQAPPPSPPLPVGPRDPTSNMHSDAQGNVQPDAGATYYNRQVSDDIVIRTTPARTAKNVEILAGLAGVGAIVGGFGVYWNLDARSATNQVSASGPTHEAWTPTQQALYDRSQTSMQRAEICYGVAGGLLAAAAIAYIATAPAETRTVIHPRVAAVPTHGGAALAASWRF